MKGQQITFKTKLLQKL